MGDEIQLALSDKGYNRDISYTEFILETEPYDKSIIIGVSLSREDYNMNDVSNFWGYVLSDANKISSDTKVFIKILIILLLLYHLKEQKLKLLSTVTFLKRRNKILYTLFNLYNY